MRPTPSCCRQGIPGCAREDNGSGSRRPSSGRAARRRSGLCLAPLLIGGLLLSEPARAPAANPETPGAVAARQLFARFCGAQCHGQDGRGGPARNTMPVIPDFTDHNWQQSRSNAQLIFSVLEGKDRLMPANRGMVTDQLAADLVAHVVRKFDPVAPPAPADGAAGDIGSGDFDADFTRLVKQFGDLKRQARQLASAPPARSPTPSAAPAALAAEESWTGAAKPPGLAPGPARLFGQACAGCHSIGGGALTGPDLKDVTRRKDRDWLVHLLLNPKGVLSSGDPYARQLLAASRGVVMPYTFGMTRERAEAVLDFIEAESTKDKSRFAALPFPDRPFTPEDVDRGRELFLGHRQLANGGPSCIACHAVYGSGVEGGRLGPDLTKVYDRVGGRTALIAHLWAPATPTMLPAYQQHGLESAEVLSLVAYLEETDRKGVEEASPLPLKFLLLGLGGSVLGLVSLTAVWGSRSRPRRRLPLDGTAAAALPAARPEVARSSQDYVGLGL
jgi:mono/diheme cytochrome c family protein